MHPPRRVGTAHPLEVSTSRVPPFPANPPTVGWLGRIAATASIHRPLRPFHCGVAGTDRSDTPAPDPCNRTPSAVIDPHVIETAHEFHNATPAPQRVRVVGTLDMVRASTQTFALRLGNGQEIQGVLIPGAIESSATERNNRVLVLGSVVYRPSGRPLRIDADEITPAPNEPSFWSRIPPARRRKLDLAPYNKPQGPHSGMSAIIGRWPGDETDEEIQAALERLS